MKTESEMNQVVGKEASLLWNAMHRYNPEAEQVVAVKGKDPGLPMNLVNVIWTGFLDYGA